MTRRTSVLTVASFSSCIPMITSLSLTLTWLASTFLSFSFSMATRRASLLLLMLEVVLGHKSLQYRRIVGWLCVRHTRVRDFMYDV